MADTQQIGPGLYVKIGLDTSGLLGGIGGVSIALNQSLELFSKFEGVAQGFVNLAVSSGRFGKEIKDNARDLGLSTKEFQQWTHTAVAAGSSAEEITGSIRMMSIRMKEAADPTSEMGKTLAALGVSSTDSSGKLRSMNDVLLDVFPALNALPEGFNRNQAAMVLFGRSFSNIADLASLSRGQLQELIDQAPVFSDEKIAKLDAFNTKMQLLNEKMERSKVLMGSELTGSFTTWVNMLDNMLQEGQPIQIFFKDLNLLLEMTAEGFVLLGGTATAFYDLLTPGSKGFGNIEEFERKLGEMGRKVMVMRDQFAHPEYYEIDLDQATKEFKDLGTEASKSAKEIQDLQRKIEDLNQDITDTMLGTQETETDLEGLWADYYKNRDERKLAAAQADPETSGGQKYAARVEELDKEQVEIVQKINRANQQLAKNKVTIQRDNQDLVTSMLEGDQKIVDSLTTRVAETGTQYAALDTIESAHWSTLTDQASIAYQAIMDYAAEAVNFAGSNPIIQKIVQLSASGYDIDPSPLPSVTAPVLKSADFSKSLNTPTTATADSSTAHDTDADAGKTVVITLNQTNYGVATDSQGVNKALGKIANLTGAGG